MQGWGGQEATREEIVCLWGAMFCMYTEQIYLLWFLWFRFNVFDMQYSYGRNDTPRELDYLGIYLLTLSER